MISCVGFHNSFLAYLLYCFGLFDVVLKMRTTPCNLNYFLTVFEH